MKNCCKNFVLMLVLSIVTIINTSGQDNSTLGKVNIASPNAAALGKYGDIPVSYHTGIPNISIPIYTIKDGSLSLPVSLSYHASGLRVDELASWVGAGWSLNAGGVITRTVRGLPDEKQTGTVNQNFGYYSDYGFLSYLFKCIGCPGADANGNVTTSTTPSLLVTMSDLEPDLFTFNFNGYTGKFWFNDDHTPMISPEQDLKIESSYTPGTWNNSPGAYSGLGRCIESFTITTPDGTKYYFGISNVTPVSPYVNPIEVTSPVSLKIGATNSQVISSWYLNKIVSADGISVINLNYQLDKYAYYTLRSTHSPTTINGSSSDYDVVKNLVAGVRLSQISTSNGKIDFIPGSVRQDLSNWTSGTDQGINEASVNTTSPALGSIKISDNIGSLCKQFNFSYNYFFDNSTPDLAITNGLTITSDKKRLQLTSLQELSCDASILIPPYNFSYYAETPPRILSFGKDHWGYNNGATGNTQLIPVLSDNTGLLNTAAGANRESAWPAMRAGALNQITYPTGGNTQFEFESNTFTVNSVDKIVGGLRIKTLTNLDPVSNQTVVTSYSYLAQGTGLSSAVLYSKPTYIQIIRNDLFQRTNGGGTGISNMIQGCLANPTPSSPAQIVAVSDYSVRPMETTQGYHLGYSEVKVSQTNNGYSVYRFSVTPPWQVDHTGVAITYANNPGTCDPALPNYPPAPLATDYYRGELNYEGHYNNTGNIIKEKYYTPVYTENPVTTPGMIITQVNGLWLTTNYELKTAHKSSSTEIENTYQPTGEYIQTQSQTFYESPYHHQATRVTTTNSLGQTIEKRIKYAFDYRVPLFDNVSNCYTGAASYLNYSNSLFYSGGYSSQMNTCLSSSDIYTCTINTYQAYLTALTNARIAYINCRRTNFTDPGNVFQTNHNSAKANADALLSPVLWLQDIYNNAPIEASTFKSGLLNESSFNQYVHLIDKPLGIFLGKKQKIDILTPVSTFTASSVSSSGTSIVKDNTYSDLATYSFFNTNLTGLVGRNGVTNSYDWGYNYNHPTVQVVNAYNNTITQNQTFSNTVSFQLGSSLVTYSSQNIVLQPDVVGNISFGISNSLPPNANVTVYYTLSGPVNQTGQLCVSGAGGTSCGTTPSNIVLSNMPVGTYTLSFTANTSFPSFAFNCTFYYSYQAMGLGQVKEYFYEGFEELQTSFVITGSSHTGRNYYSGTYTVGFTPPNNRSYTIQWWNYANGTWNLNQQAYTPNMSLTGNIDDIRVFPSDAQMSTYTYAPLTGMTSQTDPQGRTSFYEYDVLGRLKIIRDQNKNILKKYCYTYSGVLSNCAEPVTYYNSAASANFTRNNCSSGSVGSTVTYTIAANSYTSTISQADADSKAQADITANGQNYANTYGTCSAPLPCTISAASGFSLPSSGISNSGTSVNFYMVFYSTSTTMSLGTSYTVAYVGGGCIPSGSRSFTYSSSGRTFAVSIYPSGAINVVVISGSSVTPGTSINISGSYNL